MCFVHAACTCVVCSATCVACSATCHLSAGRCRSIMDPALGLTSYLGTLCMLAALGYPGPSCLQHRIILNRSKPAGPACKQVQAKTKHTPIMQQYIHASHHQILCPNKHHLSHSPHNCWPAAPLALCPGTSPVYNSEEVATLLLAQCFTCFRNRNIHTTRTAHHTDPRLAPHLLYVLVRALYAAPEWRPA